MTVSTRTINGYAVVKTLGGVSTRGVMGYAVSEPMWPDKMVEVSDLVGYALARMPSSIEVGELGGYALYQRPPQLEFHDIGGYILRKPVKPLPKDVTGHDAVIQMIIDTQLIDYSVGDFFLDPPVVMEDSASALNTTVVCNAGVTSYLYGSMTFDYYRRDIKDCLDGLELTVDFTGMSNTLDLLPAINERTGMILTADDIVSTPIRAGQTLVTVVAKSTSWFFQPGTTLQLTAGGIVNFADLFTTDTIIWS